jgi:hypothetical protein
VQLGKCNVSVSFYRREGCPSLKCLAEISREKKKVGKWDYHGHDQEQNMRRGFWNDKRSPTDPPRPYRMPTRGMQTYRDRHALVHSHPSFLEDLDLSDLSDRHEALRTRRHIDKTCNPRPRAKRQKTRAHRDKPPRRTLNWGILFHFERGAF